MIYIGIDPGKDGALAIMRKLPGEDIGVALVPFSPEEYRDTLMRLKNRNDVRCCLERVHAMPGQGVSSMFNFGENYGFIQGLLTAYLIPYEAVTPQKWKKEFQIAGDKNSSIEVCRRLFPEVSLRKTEKCRKDHDGLAEALLLAEYARRRL